MPVMYKTNKRVALPEVDYKSSVKCPEELSPPLHNGDNITILKRLDSEGSG